MLTVFETIPKHDHLLALDAALCILRVVRTLVFTVVTSFLKTARSELFLILGINILVLLISLSNSEVES